MLIGQINTVKININMKINIKRVNTKTKTKKTKIIVLKRVMKMSKPMTTNKKIEIMEIMEIKRTSKI